MTIGIYALYWEEQDLTYIGLSQNIESRFKEHLRDMLKQNHTNYKVQNTYNLYGKPILDIIEECSITELNDREIYWTKELGTLNTKHGLNIIEAGKVGWGTNSNASKYSKKQILEVFRALYNTKYTSHKNIAIKYTVSIDVVSDISKGATHLWLSSKYPKLYNRMVNKDTLSYRHQISNIGSDIVLISPEGIEVSIQNIRKFSRENNLDYRHVSHVINGDRKSHKGWKLKVQTK